MIKLPNGIDINNLIDDIRILCWEAADILLYYSKKIRDSDNKSHYIRSNANDDPVTLADLKVNELIIKGINEKFKDVCWEILSEENVKKELKLFKKGADWMWVIDPLDGTKDFIQGSGNYAMHLALNYRHKSYIGFVLIPENDELWIANGEKVWCESRDRNLVKNNMSKNKNLDEMTLVTSKNHKNETLTNLINRINFKKVLVMGSIGCKVASIIRGETDIYISLSSPGKAPKDWDFAAPEAILRAAGGAITDLENKNLIYNKKGYEQSGLIIASNNKNNHEKICLQLKNII